MKSLIKLFCFLLPLTVFTHCASIVSKSKWPVAIGSTPVGASVTITNKKGANVFQGTTPAALTLKSGAGFFAKESYLVKISMDGYDVKIISIECKLNGWYVGNILIGGLIGLLIVDPATGAMYKLRTDAVHENLTMTSVSAAPSLRIMNANELPQDMRETLVSISKID